MLQIIMMFYGLFMVYLLLKKYFLYQNAFQIRK